MKNLSKLRQSIITFVSIFFTIISLILLVNFWQKSSPEFVWTMVNVNQTEQQGDAHLIEFKNGKKILIDAGYLEPAKQKLIPFLQAKNIQNIDIVFISHPHQDHYGGILPILEAGIKIKEIYFNIPDKNLCDQEIPWGCNYAQILEYHKILKDHKTEIKLAQAGQSFQITPSILIKILYAFDGVNTPVGKTDINDLSLIMMLENKLSQHKYLFTGDLNHAIGDYLAKNAQDIKANVLKVPHHGTEGLAPNEFFAKVQPQYALVPSPATLWCSDRSARTRKWFLEQNVPIFVNGFSGHIKVLETKDKILISEENIKSKTC